MKVPLMTALKEMRGRKKYSFSIDNHLAIIDKLAALAGDAVMGHWIVVLPPGSTEVTER